MHFFISTAHSPTSKGANCTKKGKKVYEHDISKPLSALVVQKLKDADYGANLIGGGTLGAKTNSIKRLAKKLKVEDDYLALEIHFNSARAKGTCTLYRTDCEFSEDCAEIMQEILMEELELQHCGKDISSVAGTA